MTYPLFDSGYTLWAADVDTRLKDWTGTSIREMGVDSLLLLQSYYDGWSAASVVERISSQYRQYHAA